MARTGRTELRSVIPAARATPRIAAGATPSVVQFSTSSIQQHAHAAPAPSPIPTISEQDTYDIVIIGGGPAGLALANALVSHRSLQQTRILLLEGGSLAPVRDWNDQGGWSNRVSSLTAENIQWLDSEILPNAADSRHRSMEAHRSATIPGCRRYYCLCQPRFRQSPHAALPTWRQATGTHDGKHQSAARAAPGVAGQGKCHDQGKCKGERDAIWRRTRMGWSQSRRGVGTR